MARLPQQYAPLVYGIIQAAITTAVATAIATHHLTDFSVRFVGGMVFRLGYIIFDHATGRNLRCAVHSALCLGVDLVYRWRWPELTRSSKCFSTSLLAKRRRWG
jgi:hypothetical protein